MLPEGVHDYRQERPTPAALDRELDAGGHQCSGARAPLQMRVALTPCTNHTLATLIAQEWHGVLRTDTRVLAERLHGVGRAEWEGDPTSALTECLLLLADLLAS